MGYTYTLYLLKQSQKNAVLLKYLQQSIVFVTAETVWKPISVSTYKVKMTVHT